MEVLKVGTGGKTEYKEWRKVETEGGGEAAAAAATTAAAAHRACARRLQGALILSGIPNSAAQSGASAEIRRRPGGNYRQLRASTAGISLLSASLTPPSPSPEIRGLSVLCVHQVNLHCSLCKCQSPSSSSSSVHMLLLYGMCMSHCR